MADEMDGTATDTLVPSEEDEALFGDSDQGSGEGSGDGDVAAPDTASDVDGESDGASVSTDATATALRKLGIESVQEVAELQKGRAEASVSDPRIAAMEAKLSALGPQLAAAAAGRPAGSTATPAETEKFLKEFLLNPQGSLTAVSAKSTRDAIQEAMKPYVQMVEGMKDDAIVNEFAIRPGTGFIPDQDTAVLNKFLVENPYIGGSADPLGDAWELVKAKRPKFYAKRANAAASKANQSAMKKAAGMGGKGPAVTSKADGGGGDEFDGVLDRAERIQKAFS